MGKTQEQKVRFAARVLVVVVAGEDVSSSSPHSYPLSQM